VMFGGYDASFTMHADVTRKSIRHVRSDASLDDRNATALKNRNTYASKDRNKITSRDRDATNPRGMNLPRRPPRGPGVYGIRSRKTRGRARRPQRPPG
jgi:hypothetical protein